MTEKQRQRLRDVEIRAEPFFRELTRVEERIRDLQQRLVDAQSEKRRIQSRLDLLSDEKSQVWADIFATEV